MIHFMQHTSQPELSRLGKRTKWISVWNVISLLTWQPETPRLARVWIWKRFNRTSSYSALVLCPLPCYLLQCTINIFNTKVFRLWGKLPQWSSWNSGRRQQAGILCTVKQTGTCCCSDKQVEINMSYCSLVHWLGLLLNTVSGWSCSNVCDAQLMDIIMGLELAKWSDFWGAFKQETKPHHLYKSDRWTVFTPLCLYVTLVSVCLWSQLQKSLGKVQMFCSS